MSAPGMAAPGIAGLSRDGPVTGTAAGNGAASAPENPDRPVADGRKLEAGPVRVPRGPARPAADRIPGTPMTSRAGPAALATPARPAQVSEEDRAATANSRRALGICAAPSAVIGLVLGAVVAAVAAPLIGVIVFVGLAVLLTVWFRARAPHVVVRALGARPSDPADHPRVHNLVEGLCATMGLPSPALYVVSDPSANALAVGPEPRRAALVVTSGLDQSLSLVELEGVLAHELVHVKRRDTATAGAAVAVVAPLAALTGSGAGLVRALIGPGREFIADQRAASIVRYPPGLGSALETMASAPSPGSSWPPGPGRTAAVTRWLWIDPMVGSRAESSEGNLDDTGVPRPGRSYWPSAEDRYSSVGQMPLTEESRSH